MGDYYKVCSDCDAKGPVASVHNEKPIVPWNRRASDAQMRELVDIVDDYDLFTPANFEAKYGHHELSTVARARLRDWGVPESEGE